MSTPTQSMPTASGEFQASFGGAPGSADLAAECKKWEKLCTELLAQRESLRGELAKTQAERDRALMHIECAGYSCTYTKEEMLANAVYEPTIPELLATLELDEQRE